MLRFTITSVLMLLFCSTLMAKKVKQQYFDPTGRKHYFVALHITNPAGAASKIGGGLEYRNFNTSYIATFKMYYGAFKGKQYGMEWEHFFPNRRPHQYFIYMKGIVGDTTRFVNTKLSMFGHTQEIEVGPETYIGFGMGVGRRYNFKSFFVDWQLGLKYCFLSGDIIDQNAPEYEKAQQNMFRLFRFTGPGSIIDPHLTLGIQL